MENKFSYARLLALSAPLTVLLFAQCSPNNISGRPPDDGGVAADAAVFTAVADLVSVGAGDAADAAGPADALPEVLGSASSFAVLGGQTVTNTGGTRVTGNIGVSPGIVVTGFPPGTLTGGMMYLGNPVALQAQLDLTTAYNALGAAACTVSLTGQDLSGLTLKPGVYCFSTAAAITQPSDLILDAQGDSQARFIFQIASTLTAGNNTVVRVINGGSDCNVYWQVGSSATLGTGAIFAGNIVAFSSVTLGTGATVSGRVLARNAAVTMENNAVSFASCTAVPPSADLAITVTSRQTTTSPGATLVYLVTVINRGPNKVQNVAVTTQLSASGGPAPEPGIWSCSATADAACGMPAGTGNITTSVNLAVGGVVVFVVTVAIPAQGAGLLEYRAQVAPAVTAPDPELTNNNVTYPVLITPSGIDMRSADAFADLSEPRQTLSGGGFSCSVTGRGNSASAFSWGVLLAIGALALQRKLRVRLPGAAVSPAQKRAGQPV